MDPYAAQGYFNNSFVYGQGPPLPPAPPPKPEGEGYGYGWGAPPGSATNAAMKANLKNSQNRGPSFGKQQPQGKALPGNNEFFKAPPKTAYGQWVQPPMNHGSFPKKKAGGPGFHFGSNGGAKRAFGAAHKKVYDTKGKTPAMLLHELFKDVQERYEELPGTPKKYRCFITVNGSEFAMESGAKKTSKQRAAEMAVRALRPDVAVSPYEDGVIVQAVSAIKPESIKKESVPMKPISTPTIASYSVQPSSGAPPAKKSKPQISAVGCALSVLDCLRKICAERQEEGPYNPIFDFVDVTETVEGQKPIHENNKRKFRCTLTFAEQSKVFTHEGIGRTLPKDMVCREALTTMFNVRQDEIRAIIRRHVLGKATEMPILQTLYHVAQMCNCELDFKVDLATAEGMEAPRFVSTCTLTDHTQGDKKSEITSTPLNSKQEAKEYVAQEMLRTYFDIDPKMIETNKVESAVVVPACQKLQILCARTFKKNDSVKYFDLGSEGVPNTPGFAFKCKCIIQDQEFIGSGTSKKLAKNSAAYLALKGVFKFDYNEVANNDPAPLITCSQLCYEIGEYAKREYFSMCSYYTLRPSTEMAAFFLLNEKNEKRLVSIGSSATMVVPADIVATAQGTSIIHLDPIVLARRSLIRYFMMELANVDKPNSIFCKAEDGMLKLNDNLRLALYATYPPGVKFSGKDSAQKLSNLGASGYEPVGDNVQSLDEIQDGKLLKVHSTADKIFKWTHLGVQGALLSTMVHPIRLNSIFFGSESNASNAELTHSFYNRLEPFEQPVVVEAHKIQININRSVPHVWTRDMDSVEILDGATGRTNKGSPSRLCKAAFLEAYQKLNPTMSRDASYMQCKARAIAYNTNKNLLYEKMENYGLGKWQKKPVKLVDFSLGSFDA